MTTILRGDPERKHLPETGIFVRGMGEDGRFDAIDISHLTRESLVDWLRDKKPVFVEGVVLVLLGHSRAS